MNRPADAGFCLLCFTLDFHRGYFFFPTVRFRPFAAEQLKSSVYWLNGQVFMRTVRETRSTFLLGLSHPGLLEETELLVESYRGTVSLRGKLVLSFPSSHHTSLCDTPHHATLPHAHDWPLVGHCGRRH